MVVPKAPGNGGLMPPWTRHQRDVGGRSLRCLFAVEALRWTIRVGLSNRAQPGSKPIRGRAGPHPALFGKHPRSGRTDRSKDLGPPLQTHQSGLGQTACPVPKYRRLGGPRAKSTVRANGNSSAKRSNRTWLDVVTTRKILFSAPKLQRAPRFVHPQLVKVEPKTIPEHKAVDPSRAKQRGP